MKFSQNEITAEDFPLRTSGEAIVRHDGSLIATAVNAELAKDLADRLNRDQDKRHEENWSA
jgi:hypothetical protein